MGIILFRRIWDSLAKFRSKIPAIILSLVFVCGPVYSLTWYFDLIGGLYGRISMTVIVSIVPITVAFTDYKATSVPWKEWVPAYWLVVFLVLANFLAASDKFDWFGVGLQVSL